MDLITSEEDEILTLLIIEDEVDVHELNEAALNSLVEKGLVRNDGTMASLTKAAKIILTYGFAEIIRRHM